MTEVGLEEVEICVLRRQNAVAQYIVNITILDIFLVEERRPGVQVNWRWWEQAGLHFGQ